MLISLYGKQYEIKQDTDGKYIMPEELKRWENRGTSMKPAWEPIIVCQKPIEGTYAQNAEKWGVAGLNIDESRIGTEEIRIDGQNNNNMFNGGFSGDISNPNRVGRWPANLILDEQSGEILNEQAGSRKTGAWCRQDDGAHPSRFFYCPKPYKNERNAGCEGLEENQQDTTRKENNPGGDNPRNRGLKKRTNNHPTVKPINLLQYLCKLTKTPTGGTVLDCFMGSGSTGIACILEGRDFIGIEREKEYFEIAQARLNYWAEHGERAIEVHKKEQKTVRKSKWKIGKFK